ncbi:MAG: glycerol-3-phosphate 1-O-acyltransferase PlsY [Acidobacteriia bacterium]|nr:glycerol-3-phosphate 1-O-acyltransferase PlsY [Terriglobia bacterium]
MAILYIIVAVGAYLLGSIPFGYLLVKVFRGQDIRDTGSGNIGATNVARSGAKGLGAATLVLDALKGTLAVWIAGLLAPSSDSAAMLAAVAALAAVLGHVFPVWLKFKGGKGVATALGVFVMLFPWAVLVSLGVFILIVLTTRYVSLGSVLAAIAFPIAAYLLGAKDWLALLPVCAVSLIIVIKHHENIRRLLSGTESRFAVGKPASAGEKTS